MVDELEFTESGDLKRAVREAIAERKGKDVSSVRPPDAVDLDALDALFVSSTGLRSATRLSASFRYERFEVRIDQLDGVTITSFPVS